MLILVKLIMNNNTKNLYHTYPSSNYIFTRHWTNLCGQHN